MVDKYRKNLSRFPQPRHASIRGKMFTKDEGYFKTYSMKPRVVMEVTDLRDIAPIAPFCNALSDFWHWLDSTTVPPIIFLTGLNRETVDAWYRKHCADKTHAIENDFAEFESRVSTDALDLEFDTYDALGYGHLRPYFEMQKKMKLTGSGWFFTRHGGRMSGVPNTSLGNSIVNFSGHKNFFDAHGFVPGRDYAMAVNGDDNVIFCTERVYKTCELHLADHFAALCMKAELVLHTDPKEANFCSSRFGQLPNGQYVLACHPFRALAKAGKLLSFGSAGTSAVAELFRDYSSTPNFWPVHVFCREWLRRMNISYEVAPSASYSAPINQRQFLHILRQTPTHPDGTWIIPSHPLLRAAFEAEGLIEPPGKQRNFEKPYIRYGLPPRWGIRSWMKKAQAIREKLLNFWRSSDYNVWKPRLDNTADGVGNLRDDLTF